MKLFKIGFFIWVTGSLILSQNCSSPENLYTHKVITEEPEIGVKHAEDILQNTPIELADGLEVTLWASDSLAPDPIAMSIDNMGRVHLTRTNRQKNSEFDIRGHKDWMTSSISLQSVEDRRAFLKETFAPEKSEENTWLKDLNGDGVHDWQDLTVEKDEIWRIEDQNKDGVADISTRILDDFNEEITDVAGGLLVRDNDLFIAIGPDLWRLTDSNKDGKLDAKESISHGYAVHVGFGGHGMSGITEGPDGKIYWGIGDIGANIISKEGKAFKYPNQGVLVRSNPDGTDFEVFAAGLRNTHEFVFDEYGNIIGSDNDGDHPGESERLIYIVEGADAGWRTNWQFGKYTDPKNNTYKVWMDEKLYLPRWEGQAAYIVPPIMNFHNGPTGMAYNPGTALGSKWKNKFFLVEFVGTPSRSPIWAFNLKPSGASFILDQEEKALLGILPTAIQFGPDGALYAADWINGWGTKNYGRVWRLDVKSEENDLAQARVKTQELMQLNYQNQDNDSLYELLFYDDMRIRKKAQFELVERGTGGFDRFIQGMSQKDNQLARIHSIWGIGQMIRKGQADPSALLTGLTDEDLEIVSQTAKVIGEVRFEGAGDQLISLLKNENYRVRFFAAQALGRIKYNAATQPLIDMLAQNADEDVYLRHAGVLALSRIGDIETITKLADHPDQSLRLAAVLILRRMQHSNIAIFLNDEDEFIVTEAARAINDDWSIESALPNLASLLAEDRFESEPLIRRAINAASRVGGNKEIDLLIDFVNRQEIDPKLRAEAINVLGTWASPSVLDRVDGRLRGEISRDPSHVISQFSTIVKSNLQSSETEIVVAMVKALAALNMADYSNQLALLAKSHTKPEVRACMITGLYQLNHPDLATVVQQGLNDRSETVRTTSIGLIQALDISKENLPKMIAPIFSKGSVKEQQQILQVMGEMPIEKTESTFEDLVNQWINGKLNDGISLDLIESIDVTQSEKLLTLLAPHRPKGQTSADFQDVLYGGDSEAGQRIFMWNSTAQCVRCHSMEDKPNAVGPPLRSIANELTREELLQALIEPSARLSPGFGTVVLTLTDDSTVSGILMEENEDELILKTSNAEPLEIPVQRITKRVNVPSSMPPMGSILSRREIRDLVAYLAELKQ